ncbi:hypothetical protein N0V95_007749 [Ascochyta clinopodiicola]|nr:hypothetical protein N0V95_007749 [Ascochyta clinopodiicola]
MGIKPLENPATADWDLKITHSDYNKMLEGFRPQQMEDKWMILADTPDSQGNTVVHIYRSWGCHEYISLDVKAGDPKDTGAKEWATAVKISWNEHLGNMENKEEEVKELFED